MSSFIVSQQTMQRVVTTMHPPDHPAVEADQLGRDLYAMNQRAIEARYGEPDEVPEFQWAFQMPPEDRKGRCELLKAIDCLIYQCSEGEVPKEVLFKQLEECRDKLRREIIGGLPEYKGSPWDAPCERGRTLSHTNRVCGLLKGGKKAEAIAAHNARVESEFERARQGEVINLSDLMAAREQIDLADEDAEEKNP